MLDTGNNIPDASPRQLLVSYVSGDLTEADDQLAALMRRIERLPCQRPVLTNSGPQRLPGQVDRLWTGAWPNWTGPTSGVPRTTTDTATAAQVLSSTTRAWRAPLR
ncbi:hypothetical protein GCM10027610_082160 [Dactylosporangium cerinum]